MRTSAAILASLLGAASPALAAELKPQPLDVDLADAEAALLADDACGGESGAYGETCALNALQRRARTKYDISGADEANDTKGEAASSATCQGEWCTMLEDFIEAFDTDEPYKVQAAVDKDAEYATYSEGIKLAVTKHDFYLMYHGNVARKLQEYLPQHLFEWKFDKHVAPVGPTSATEATVARNGTISFNLGWWKRQMFWNYAVRALPNGGSFPFSEAKEFDDCTGCPAKMLFRLKKGGLEGNMSKGWKIVDLTLIKLK